MKRLWLVSCAVLLSSCTDGTGSDCVGEDVRCEGPADEDIIHLRGTYQEVSTKGMGELTPAWIRPLPMLSSDSSWSTLLLTNDFEGDIWYFAQRDQQLVANKLDADGEITESRAFDAPNGAEVVPGAGLILDTYRQSAEGPTIRVIWPTNIKADGFDPLTTLEWIKFGESLEDPRRIDADERTLYWDTDLMWDSDGTIYGMKRGGSVEKFDAKGERIWKQGAMSSEHRRDGVETHFGLLGGQHVGMFATDFSHSTSASVIEADGNYGATFSMPYWWTEVRPSALFIVLHRLHAPFIQQGAKGPVIISETTRGDLVVANLQTKQRTLNGVSIRREDYTPLTRAQSAIDPEGNTYIAVVFGGRTVSDQRLAICRVPFEGEPACMQLAQSPEFEGEREFIQLATNADGVLFLRTEKAFARIDFPGR